MLSKNCLDGSLPNRTHKNCLIKTGYEKLLIDTIKCQFIAVCTKIMGNRWIILNDIIDCIQSPRMSLVSSFIVWIKSLMVVHVKDTIIEIVSFEHRFVLCH